ncbi:MAG: FHA domain-containing protein [Bradymonadaceae bacterium]|nr:FHA domain-containing protein [Lujinxingiaceae bacterium]
MPNPCPNCQATNTDDEIVCQGCGLTLPGLHAVVAETTRPEQKMPSFDSNVGLVALSSADDTQTLTARANNPTLTQKAVSSPALTQISVAREAAERASALIMPAPLAADELPIDARTLRIGYSKDNDLVIPVPQVSAHHAVLGYSSGAYVLKDLGSTNGTYINGHRVLLAHVKPGDKVGLGSYEFVLNTSITERISDQAPLQATQALGAIGVALRQPVVIGRDSDCDIVLDAPQISRRHLRLHPNANGWRLQDLDSANGTFVNERNNRVEDALVTDDDVLFLGSYRFPVSRLHDFLDGEREAVHSGLVYLPTDKPVVSVGRGLDNDVVLDGPQISRHHARIIRSEGQLFLEDLGSANGTFIEGERIQRACLEPGQTVSFGSYTIRLDLARGTIQKSYSGDILLQAENLRVEVDDAGTPLRILDGVSFTVYPTEVVGLLGPSGAGKTTLLMSLIGYLRPTYGRTLLNGDELSTHYDRYRGAIGYVPQEDIIHDQLTVYEALYYTAKLRLPPDTTDEEIDWRITKVLADLEILETRNVQIGSPARKGISGGQRKRVNLAMELLTEPSLLCLDEPTSGLASEDALNVVRLLRKLADGGRTIMMTIHQPSLQVYRLLDNTLYLADGEMVYYGPAYPDSLLYFHPELKTNSAEAEEVLADPGSCMRPLVEAKRGGEPMETFAARYRQSMYHEEFVVERRKNRTGVRVTGSGERRPPRFSVRQWLTLCRRYLNIKLKDRVGTWILLIQAPIVALLLNLVFISETGGVLSRMQFTPYALFLMVVSAIWFGCSNAAREIVGEQVIYKRERMVNLSVAAYVASKFAILAILCFVQCTTLLAFTYFVLDFKGNPLFHLGVLWVCSLAGVAMGLMLSALVRTSEAAIALVPILLIPQVILGGAIMPVDRMSHPTWLASHSVVSRWGFEGMLQAEHLADAYELSADQLPKPLAPGLPALPPPPNPLDRFFGDAETWLAVDFGVVLGFTLLLLVGVGLTLRVRETW